MSTALPFDLPVFEVLSVSQRDGQLEVEAVSLATAAPWSNGRVEGHVNRLKLVKRQMYGQASFELLRTRVIHPP